MWVSSKLQWKLLNSDYFALTADKTSILALKPGLYAVGVLVNHLPAQSNAGSISLQKNGIQVQSAAAGAVYDSHRGCYVSHNTSTSLMCIVQIEKDELISVVCSETAAISKYASYLTAVRIGA